MREKLSRFMYGRYGMDNLNNFLWVIAIAMMVVNLFVNNKILTAVTWIFLIFWFYRMLSRDISARTRENEKFVGFLDRFPNWFPRFRSRTSGYNQYNGNNGYNGYGSYGNTDQSSYGSGYTQTKQAPKDKTKKVFKCPSCKQKVRVPKGKGKIMITCPKCGNQFQKRT